MCQLCVYKVKGGPGYNFIRVTQRPLGWAFLNDCYNDAVGRVSVCNNPLLVEVMEADTKGLSGPAIS